MYCKTAQNDPATVRGARNYPCQEFPGKRAPTVALCRDPKRLCPDRHQPVAWTADPLRHPGDERAEHLAAQQVPVHPAGHGPGSGHTDRRPAPAGCGASDPVLLPTSRSRCNRRPTPAVPMAGRPGYRLRRTRRRTRKYRSRRRFQRPHRRKDSRLQRRTRRRRSRGAHRLARRRRPTARTTPPTTRAPELSRTLREALVSSRPAEYRAPRTGWT